MSDQSRRKARRTVRLYKTAAYAVRFTPRFITNQLPRLAGRIGPKKISPTTRQLIIKHQSRARGVQLVGNDADKAVREVCASYARYWVESFRIPTLDKRRLETDFDYEGVEHLLGALEQGRGCVVACPHLGSWEWAGAWMCSVGYPLTVVVERVEPPELFEWFKDLRQSLGMTVVAHDDNAAQAVAAAIGRNETVVLMCDRDITGKGVEIDFFGEKTTVPSGPALLSLRAGAPLVPIAIYQAPHGRQKAVVLPAVTIEETGALRADVTALTQKFFPLIEDFIRKAPEQWHLLQPNWPSDFELEGVK